METSAYQEVHSNDHWVFSKVADHPIAHSQVLFKRKTIDFFKVENFYQPRASMALY